MLLLANLNHKAATAAPSGCEAPPRNADHVTALVLEPIARYNGRDMANPSVILCMKSAMKTENPSVGFAWLVAYVMKPSGALCNAIASEVCSPIDMKALVATW